MPRRIEMRLATSASPIHIAATNQMFSSTDVNLSAMVKGSVEAF